MSSLDEIRGRIDTIDRELAKLLNNRATLGLEVAKVKEKEGKPIFHPDREREVLERITKNSSGPLSDEALRAIFLEIISATRSVEAKSKIALLGPEGTFTHLAGLKAFGRSCDYVFMPDFDATFESVEKGETDFGVVPIENSSEGQIGRTLDLLLDTSLTIYGELYLPIHHNLLSKELSISNIKTVYSHYMPLAQSHNWMERNLPGVKIIETKSTTSAVEKAAQEPQSGAIGALETATVYSVPVLAKSIEDSSSNTTRFLILSKTDPPRGAKEKTSLAILLKDRPGALMTVLGHFSEKEINMTRIESRPIGGHEWQYAFFIDIEGHRDDKTVGEVLSRIDKNVETLKILGSYSFAE